MKKRRKYTLFDLCWECGGELLNVQVCDVCLARVRLQYWIKLDIFEETFTLTPGVNFTNILCAAFTLVGPKSAKKILIN